MKNLFLLKPFFCIFTPNWVQGLKNIFFGSLRRVEEEGGGGGLELRGHFPYKVEFFFIDAFPNNNFRFFQDLISFIVMNLDFSESQVFFLFGRIFFWHDGGFYSKGPWGKLLVFGP